LALLLPGLAKFFLYLALCFFLYLAAYGRFHQKIGPEKRKYVGKNPEIDALNKTFKRKISPQRSRFAGTQQANRSI